MAWVAILFLFGLSTYLFYFFLTEKPYLSYAVLPIPVLKENVRAGDIMPLEITRCNSSDRRHIYSSAHYLDDLGYDQEIMALDMFYVSIDPGCLKTISSLHRIPESTQPGRYQIIGTAKIPGILRNFEVDWISEPFNVLAGPTGKSK